MNTLEPPIVHDKISIGEQMLGVTISNIDTIIIGGYYSPKYFDIDINSDGVSDISFMSEQYGSPAMGLHPRTKIFCLNSQCELFGYYSNDTTFFNDTIVFLQNEQSDTVTDAYLKAINSCQPIGIDDSIDVLYQAFRIKVLAENDSISNADIFKCDTLFLTNEGYSAFPYYYLSGAGTDTVFYFTTSTIRGCNNFPPNLIRYIGLKMNVSGVEKLGWIKLSIIDKYKITIHQSAIQD